MGSDFFVGEPRTNSKHYIAVKMDENDDDINIKINLWVSISLALESCWEVCFG